MNRHLLAFTKTHFIKSVFTFLFLCLISIAFGQPGNEKGLPFVKNYPPQLYDGLNTNWSVIQGDDGIMYFGNPTAGSDILQYDGVHWTKIDALGKALINRCFKKSPDGIIYYGGSNNFGYLAHDHLGKTVEISLSKYVPKNKQDFTDVWSIQVAEKDIYFQSRERLFRLTKSGDKWITKTWDPVTHFMYSFYLDGVLYIHEQGKGLFKMVNDSLVLIPNSEFLGKERMQVMMPYNESNGSASHQYLIGTFTRGLYIFDGKNFKPFPSPIDSLIKNTLVYRGIQINGNYALSILGRGVVIIDPQGKIKQRINKTTGLASDIVYDFVIGKRGALWLATDNGISQVDVNSPFTTFNSQSGISAAPLSMARLPDGTLYVGSNNGLLRYNTATDNFQMVNQIPRDQMFTVVADGNTLLVPANGLYMIKDGKAMLVQPSVNDSLKLSHLFISKKYPDLLYGATTFGLTLFVRDPGKTTGWRYLGYFPKSPPNIFGIAEDENGRTWAGSQNGEAIRVTPFFDKNGQPDVSKSKVETFGKDQGLKDFTSRIFSLNHQIYFLTDSSTLTYDESKKHFVQAALLGKHFFAGREDGKGKVTVTAFKNLNAISTLFIATSGPSGKYRVDSTSLMPIMNMVEAGYYYDIHDNDIIWFLADDQLIRYDSKIKTNADQPYKTLISGITSNKISLNPFEGTANNPQEISFKNNSLRFDYATPFYVDEDKTQYQTWLEGFEKGWSDWDKNTYKEYTNLSAGKYIFHVRAKNIYGKLSDTAVFPLTILAPWYATWWAYLLYALAGILLIYLFIRYRTQHLEEKHRELEKTIDERTAELSSRVKELAVINSVQEGLVSKLDMQSIYDLVGNKIRNAFDAQVVLIGTFEETIGTEHFNFTIENGKRYYPDSRPLDKLRKQLIETRQKIVINNIEESFKWFGNKGVEDTGSVKSAIFVPLLIGDKVKRYVSLQNVDRENAFSASDVRLLETLANSMSVALENARLFDETTRLLKETEQRNSELAIINSVQEGLVAQMDIEGIYTLVGDRIRDLFDAQTVVIRSFDYKNELEIFNYAIEKRERLHIPSRPWDNFSKHLIQIKKPEVIHDNFEKYISQFSETANLEGEIPKSAVFVPLVLGEKIIGNVSLQNVDHENAFTDSDASLLTTLANSMSVALENARLFDETSRLLKETEQRTAELSVINSVQEGLAKELNMHAIYELVGNKLSDVMHTLDIDIRLFSPETNQVFYPYVRDQGKMINVAPSTMAGMSKQVFETGKALIINEKLEERMKELGSYILPGTQVEKSFMAVPIIIGNKPRGMVSISNYEKENAFSDSDVRLLQTVVSAMSVALENARLFDETTRLLKETEQRTAELAVINSVQDGLVREMNMAAIYELVGNRLCDLFPDTQTLVIRTFDHSAGLEHWQYAIEKGIRLQTEPRPINWINKELITTKNAININEDFIETARKYGGVTVTVGMPPKSVIFVPMIVGDVVKGSVSLQNVDRENAFNDSDVRLLTTLTNSMSVALENARLFDETTRLLADAKQRASELTTVNNISKALASQLNPNELIQFVGDQLRDLFKANIAYLALLNKKTKMIYFPYQFGEIMPARKIGDGLTSKIIMSGEPLLINKDLSIKHEEMGILQMGTPASSYLGVPIPEGDEIVGVLSVQSTEQENRFNENDQRLLTTIASSVGVALRNAQLFEDVEQAKMEAEKASKVAEKANEAKSAFLSTVSHELRTPLTSVLGFAKIINKRLNDKIFPAVNQSDPKTGKTIAQINENLHVVISEGERLTHLINDVLDLAKIEAGRMEWNQENVSLPEVVERAVLATTSLFDQKGIKLIKKIGNDIPDIIGDEDKLIQVVINLFSNAVKFTEKGNVTCEVSQKDNEVIVQVSDTGIGIAPEDYGAVFEQFRQVGGDTLTDKPKGTGLGLPICKEIVEHHGGRIWVEGRIGKGSTFSFAIPFVPSDNKNIKKQKPIHLDELVKQLKEQMVFSKLKTNGKMSTILVVDDDDSIRSLLEQELSEAGYLIEQATNGKQALECIRKNRPDLIILDVMMPEMNGFDVAAILKNDPQTMDIPIIILSIVQDKARGFRIGVDRYLTKPIDTVQLFTEVGNLLEQGKSKRKVMVVDEDSAAVRSLTDVLQTKGYQVVESDGKELVQNAIATQPDIIILNSVFSGKQEIVQTLRFEKGLENVLFFIYQ